MTRHPRLLALAAAFIVSTTGFPAEAAPSPASQAAGVLRSSSAYPVDETVARIKAAVEAKGIRYFAEIDQQELGESAKLPIRQSTLVLFGNPPLGVQFLQANPYAGLDWPVRMLVRETEDGSTEIAWTDFGFIADRYGLTGLPMQVKMASDVAATVAAEAGR